jgi:hypothetical protein
MRRMLLLDVEDERVNLLPEEDIKQKLDQQEEVINNLPVEQPSASDDYNYLQDTIAQLSSTEDFDRIFAEPTLSPQPVPIEAEPMKIEKEKEKKKKKDHHKKDKKRKKGLSVADYIDDQAQVGEASEDEDENEAIAADEDLFGENADNSKKKKKKKSRKKKHQKQDDDDDDEEDDINKYTLNDVVVADDPDILPDATSHRIADNLYLTHEEQRLQQEAVAITDATHAKKAILQMVIDLPHHLYDLAELFNTQLTKSLTEDMYKKKKPKERVSVVFRKIPDKERDALFHLLADALYSNATDKASRHINHLLQGDSSDLLLQFKQHEQIMTEWTRQLKVKLSHRLNGLEHAKRVYPWMPLMDMAANVDPSKMIQHYRVFPFTMPAQATNYRCIITGRILQPNESVFVLAIQRPTDLQCCYIAKHADPNRPNYYIDAATNMLDIVDGVGIVNAFVQKFNRDNPSRQKSMELYSGIYQRMKDFMMDKTAVFELFRYFMYSYSLLHHSFLLGDH